MTSAISRFRQCPRIITPFRGDSARRLVPRWGSRQEGGVVRHGDVRHHVRPDDEGLAPPAGAAGKAFGLGPVDCHLVRLHRPPRRPSRTVIVVGVGGGASPARMPPLDRGPRPARAPRRRLGFRAFGAHVMSTMRAVTIAASPPQRRRSRRLLAACPLPSGRLPSASPPSPPPSPPTTKRRLLRLVYGRRSSTRTTVGRDPATPPVGSAPPVLLPGRGHLLYPPVRRRHPPSP